VGKFPYLFRRKNVYYFRIRVPAEHQELLNATEIVRSLKTESRHEAIPRALQLAANIATTFNELKSGTICDLRSSELISQVSQKQVLAKISTITVRSNTPKAPLLQGLTRHTDRGSQLHRKAIELCLYNTAFDKA